MMQLESFTPITEDTDHEEDLSPSSYAPYRVSDDVWMVPCKLNPMTHEFSPLCRLGLQESFLDKFTMRHIWMPQEDQLITELVAKYGKKAWSMISSELNKAIHAGKPVRLSKQCRERWLNHLDPSLKKGNWSAEEDLYILERQRQLGNRWSEIARYLEGRNENAVKNRWNSLVKRAEKERPSEIDAITYLIGQKQNQMQMVSQVHESPNYMIYTPQVMFTPPQPMTPTLSQPMQMPQSMTPSMTSPMMSQPIAQPMLAMPFSMPRPQAIKSVRNHLFGMATDGCFYDNSMSFVPPKSFF
mmetsp:Transcript_27372/g.49273  ORF Transcript_27372/g.49273 Transcript_27372/m.49273 type:complete len:299 (-) Transcript_27372:4857-5753(-)|eukprot:CAMPEP_0204898498 /NCGR_PEP_ID=MMETSP1397-20131031/1325_1 /ASSEMBLY_ACC=CAM_ASM_000891 /TAXON_ID=49980 /ORGANISM="Climacostomum Climacostomum virens, Strain Stock W-24" /LENGTH=298 /DNA_ID=CAMNT_0052066359 /DNA_START=897 /DNA_END=1793 /DNA_ORIENTATION=+